MVQLNLLPDVKKEFLKSQRMKRNIISFSIIAAIVVGLLVLLLALYVHGAQRIARSQLQKDIDKSSKELQSQKDISKILTVQGALAVLPALHEQKYINSRFFDYLKVLVPNDASLSKVDLSNTGTTLKITGRSADYKTLNIFADTLKRAQFSYGPKDQREVIAPFSNVTIASANTASGANAKGIDFTIDLQFNALIFAATTKDPSMSVPNTTTGQGFKSGQLFSGTPKDKE